MAPLEFFFSDNKGNFEKQPRTKREQKYLGGAAAGGGDPQGLQDAKHTDSQRKSDVRIHSVTGRHVLFAEKCSPELSFNVFVIHLGLQLGL